MIAMIIQAIARQVNQAMGGILQNEVRKEQEDAANKLMNMTNRLGIVELVMERQRQEAGRDAMAETLQEIDEAYGEADTPRSRVNRSIIQAMISQLGRTATRGAAEAATAKGGQEALSLRQGTAARGVGGSAAEQMARSVTGLAAGRRAAISGEREQVEYDVARDIEGKRLGARGEALELLSAAGKFKGKSAMDDVLMAIMGESAMKQEKYRHIPALVGEIGGGIAEGIKMGSQFAEGAAAEDEKDALKKADKEAREKERELELYKEMGVELRS